MKEKCWATLRTFANRLRFEDGKPRETSIKTLIFFCAHQKDYSQFVDAYLFIFGILSATPSLILDDLQNELNRYTRLLTVRERPNGWEKLSWRKTTAFLSFHLPHILYIARLRPNLLPLEVVDVLEVIFSTVRTAQCTPGQCLSCDRSSAILQEIRTLLTAQNTATFD